MFKKLVIISILASLFVWSSPVHAGFGIRPPYVKPEKPIMAGTRYEQRITLLRSSADADMQAEIKVNAPEIANWITVDKGNVFDLPKDELTVPMVVVVNVPPGAEIGNYKGHINIRITPKQDSNAGGVAIALGARVEIDITITDEIFVDFVIRKVAVPPVEQLKAPWNWPLFSWFFYRIKVDMTIENTGNTKTSPTKVHIDVYDIAKKELLESHDDRRLGKIDPFLTGDVQATFPTKLEPGEYWSRVSIYKDEEIIQKNEIIFRVYAPGESPIPLELGKWPYIMMTGLILFALLFLYVLIKVRIWRHLWLIIMLVTWPLRFVYRKILLFKNAIKRKFWQYMHKKASKYQGKDETGDE